MTAQKGLEFTLAVEDGSTPGDYNVIGGMRSNSLAINNEVVDVTNKSSTGVRTLLEGAGVNSIEVSGSAVFFDDVEALQVLVAAEGNTHLNFQLTVPSATTARTYTGEFAVASATLAGEYNGEVTYELTLQSAGVITKA